MLKLTSEEWEALRSQIVTLKTGRGQHRKYLPNAFTEQNVAMLSIVFRSQAQLRVRTAQARSAIAANLKELGYGG
jgi:hypothetical protein